MKNIALIAVYYTIYTQVDKEILHCFTCTNEVYVFKCVMLRIPKYEQSWD